VIEDGKCKLVFDRAGKPHTSGISAFVQEGHYYLYYKTNLTPIRVDIQVDNADIIQFSSSPTFVKKSRKVFADCPQLVEQIQKKEIVASDIREIVRQFNRCLE
jgi:hypothetical protein